MPDNHWKRSRTHESRIWTPEKTTEFRLQRPKFVRVYSKLFEVLAQYADYYQKTIALHLNFDSSSGGFQLYLVYERD